MSNIVYAKRRKILGQHILIDDKIIERIIKYCKINKDDVICEMGSGTGKLTRRIAEFGNKVESYEIDRNFFENVRKLEGKFANLKIINGDLLDNQNKNKDFDVFISNIPYSKSKEILLWLATKKFRYAIIMVQKEFADKLKITCGDPNYRAISAICQYRFNVEELFSVGKNAFNPVPKVESQVIRLSPRNNADIDGHNILSNDDIKKVNLFFSAKNKLLSYIIKKYSIKYNTKVVRMYIENKARIKDLKPEIIVNLAKNCDFVVK